MYEKTVSRHRTTGSMGQWSLRQGEQLIWALWMPQQTTHLFKYCQWLPLLLHYDRSE